MIYTGEVGWVDDRTRGEQSMNVGPREARDLTAAMKKVLGDGAWRQLGLQT